MEWTVDFFCLTLTYLLQTETKLLQRKSVCLISLFVISNFLIYYLLSCSCYFSTNYYLYFYIFHFFFYFPLFLLLANLVILICPIGHNNIQFNTKKRGSENCQTAFSLIRTVKYFLKCFILNEL